MVKGQRLRRSNVGRFRPAARRRMPIQPDTCTLILDRDEQMETAVIHVPAICGYLKDTDSKTPATRCPHAGACFLSYAPCALPLMSA
jgi:hypothetical protein